VDFVVSVFKLLNRRGYTLPAFNFGCQEKDTGTEWRATCGGTRAYLVRYAAPLDRDMDEQAAESHFMMWRVTGALLMSGFDLLQAEPAGGVILKSVPCRQRAQRFSRGGFAPCAATHIPDRAAEDAHAALINPHEALVFVYRGLEWLIEGLPQRTASSILLPLLIRSR
jgi:hypothetical protein